MIQVLLIIHLFLALGLVIVVLLQRSEGGALGMGGGAGHYGRSYDDARVSEPAYAGNRCYRGVFLTTSLLLAILSSSNRAPTSILDRPGAPQTQQTIPAPIAPAVCPLCRSRSRYPQKRFVFF